MKRPDLISAMKSAAFEFEKMAAEIEWLRREQERLFKLADDWRSLALSGNKVEIDKVIVAYAKDAERLDWLDKVNANANERNGTKYGWKFDINHNRAALTDCNIPALNIRQAIDQAMLAAAQEQEGKV